MPRLLQVKISTHDGGCLSRPAIVKQLQQRAGRPVKREVIEERSKQYQVDRESLSNWFDTIAQEDTIRMIDGFDTGKFLAL